MPFSGPAAAGDRRRLLLSIAPHYVYNQTQKIGLREVLSVVGNFEKDCIFPLIPSSHFGNSSCDMSSVPSGSNGIFASSAPTSLLPRMPTRRSDQVVHDSPLPVKGMLKIVLQLLCPYSGMREVLLFTVRLAQKPHDQEISDIHRKGGRFGFHPELPL